MTTTFHLLGSGGSTGVPAIGCDWGDCDPDEPKNRRTRSSVVIKSDTTTLVVDTGPEFREQFNKTGFKKIDAVFYTHAHADHINGIDDLRLPCYKQGCLIPAFASKDTLDKLDARFPYLFNTEKNSPYRPILEPLCIEESDYYRKMQVGDIKFSVFSQDHGPSGETLGLKFEDTAYSPDMVRLSEEALNHIKGVKNWVVDGSGHDGNNNNPAHASIDQICKYNEVIGAERVILVHLIKEMDYHKFSERLKPGYELGYDGLDFEINSGL